MKFCLIIATVLEQQHYYFYFYGLGLVEQQDR